MSNFPVGLDAFQSLDKLKPVNASYANAYTGALVACQTEIESLVQINNSANRKIVGFCWRVLINATLISDNNGTGENHSSTYRFERPRHPHDSEVIGSGGGGKRWRFTHDEPATSLTPLASLVTLPIPSGSSIIPNTRPFHPNNSQFITIETQQKTSFGDPGKECWWYNDQGTKSFGGFYNRDGVLYYNGVNDYNPQLVIADWTKMHFGIKDQLALLGDVYQVFVHMVIIG